MITFEPLAIRDITFANRVFVSPCAVLKPDGYATTAFCASGTGRRRAGLVLTEQLRSSGGRISPQDWASGWTITLIAGSSRQVYS